MSNALSETDFQKFLAEMAKHEANNDEQKILEEKLLQEATRLVWDLNVIGYNIDDIESAKLFCQFHSGTSQEIFEAFVEEYKVPLNFGAGKVQLKDFVNNICLNDNTLIACNSNSYRAGDSNSYNNDNCASACESIVSGWTCKYCTFVNEDTNSNCMVCMKNK